MVKLGTHDPEVTRSAINRYFSKVRKMLNADLGVAEQRLRGDQVGQFVSFTPLLNSQMKVVDVQRFLQNAGFFPDAVIDGICGYRTQSAIRLFQEYTRVFHPQTLNDYPDGQFGPKSFAAAQRWIEKGLRADWSTISATSPIPEFPRWLQLISRFKDRSLVAPSPLLRKAIEWKRSSATIKPDNWTADSGDIHLLGIRYGAGEGLATRTFDDLFILLLNGLVFKFRGSTDPGKTSHPQGAPFLVPGQHQYQFGWHPLSSPDKAYHALRPVHPGLLVLRTKKRITEEAISPRSKVELNATINIHWGGKGRGHVHDWSEGCQVMTGDRYLNHHGSPVDCAAFSAPNASSLGRRLNGIYQTKGAYSVLTDLVTALSGQSQENRTVLFTLLDAEDLRLIPQLNDLAQQARIQLAQNGR